MSWEVTKPPELVVGLIHRGQTTMEFALHFAQLYNRLALTRKFYLSYSRGMPYDCARNACVDDALKRNAKWLFFLDSDVIVKPDVVDRLIAHNLPIVSGLYYRRHKPVTAAAWLRAPPVQKCPSCGSEVEKKGKYNPIISYERGRLIEVDVIGFGCVLIHRKVLERVHHPPDDPMFIWTAGREGQLKETIWRKGEQGTSEDFYACERIKKAGFHVFVDPNVWTPHYGEVKFVPPEQMDIDNIKYGGVQFPEI